MASLLSTQTINIHCGTWLLYDQSNPIPSIVKHNCSMVNPTHQHPLRNTTALGSTQPIIIYCKTWLLYEQSNPSTSIAKMAALCSIQPITIHFETWLLFVQFNTTTSIAKHGSSMFNQTHQCPLWKITLL